jgi:hypothetical protein
MRVKAIATWGKDLSRKSLESLHHPEENFQLKMYDIYTVYGINVWRDVIHYFTFDENNTTPSWHPADLFEIIDYRLPPEWYFRFYGYENRRNDLVYAVWGYKELALNPEHYFQLIEVIPEAINLFNKRKLEIDKFHGSL